MTIAAFQTFRLFMDRACSRSNGAVGPRDLASPLEFIEVSGPTSLAVRDGALAILPLRTAGAITLAPIRHQGRPLLLMTAPEQADVRVNGQAVGPVHVLDVKDVVDFGGGDQVLHISLFHRPYSGPALAEHVGRECPICLGPINLGTPVLVCAHCQETVLHDASGGGEQLECAKTTSTCPCCEQPLIREEGYAYVLDA